MSEFDSWKYYNHAVIPTTAPHEVPDLEPVISGQIWSLGGMLARWTTDFDCEYETEWWYCIKDKPFDITQLNSNYRYKINKGNKYFEVHEIKPEEHIESLFKVQMMAFSAYPQKYRLTIKYDDFLKNVGSWKRFRVYGAFFKETEELCGYALIRIHKTYVELNVQKTMPAYEKYQINAAIVYRLLEDFKDKLKSGFYICDGARNILHETAFQDYLEKYFGFRKAYCKLHIKYRFPFGIVIAFGKPFMRLISKTKNKYFYNYFCLLKQDCFSKQKVEKQ